MMMMMEEEEKYIYMYTTMTSNNLDIHKQILYDHNHYLPLSSEDESISPHLPAWQV